MAYTLNAKIESAPISSYDVLSYKKGAFIVMGAYFFIILVYLHITDYSPFVFDNNETYSSIIHAKNILTFDFWKTFGLTNESYGLVEAAHPYAYTHQGNFPRFFAALLYLFGAESSELQIFFTCLSVGALSVFLAYHFFAKTVSPLFALIYCVVILTDYIMHFQWHVNTWRVWHFFFMFSSLLLVERSLSRPRLFWIPLTVANFAALLYFEIVYAVFVSITCAVYTLLYFKNFKKVLCSGLVTGGGALLGILVLVSQLVLYLGVEGFLQDMNLTFNARNFSPTDFAALQDLRGAIWEFVRSNRVVFWDNFISSTEELRSVPSTVQLFFRFNILVYTPFLVFLTFSVSVAAILAAMLKHIKIHEYRWSKTGLRFSSERLIVVLAFIIFSLVVIGDRTFAGFSPSPIKLTDVSALSQAGLVFMLLAMIIWLAPLNWTHRFTKPSDVLRTGVAVTYLLVLSAFAKFHFGFYSVVKITSTTGAAFEPFWKSMLSPMGEGMAPNILALLSGFVGVKIILADRGFRVSRSDLRILRLLPFLIAGIIGFTVAWTVLSGYIFTAYYNRYAPFTVYVHSLLIVVPVYFLLRRVSGNLHFIQRSRVLSPAISMWKLNTQYLFMLLVVLLPIIFYWFALQKTYFYKFSYDHFSFLKLLDKPPYKGASFAVNTYAAPVATQTRQWAYYDPSFSRGRVHLTEDGYFHERDTRYLWFADFDKNPEYKTPQYFLCVMHQNYQDLVYPKPRCDVDSQIVGLTKDGKIDYLKHKITDQDTGPDKRWAIIKLDDNLPPYIAIKGFYLPTVSVSAAMKKNVLHVDYEFRHQRGEKEVGTEISIYKLKSCSASPTGQPVMTVVGGREIVSKGLVAGSYQVSVVPATARRQGEAYWSAPFKLDRSQRISKCKSTLSPKMPTSTKASLAFDGRSAELAWVLNESVRGYDIFKSVNGEMFTRMTIVDGAKRSYLDENLKVGQKTLYKIRACTDWQCSSFTDPVPAAPDTPTRTSLYRPQPDQIIFMWQPVSNAREYVIEEKIFGENFRKVDAVPAGKSSLSFTISEIDKQIAYRVLACDKYFCSAPSESIILNRERELFGTDLSRPSLTVFGKVNDLVRLKWLPISGAHHFSVEFNDGSGFREIAVLPHDRFEHMMGGLFGNYEFRVRACRATECSQFSDVIKVSIN